MSANDRVAVVVVHGIADQLPGQTVREVARLLCHEGAYEQGELVGVLVPVEKLEPGSLQGKPQGARQMPGTPSGFYQTQAPQPEAHDLGIALNDYLLERLVLPEGDALYESTRITLTSRTRDRALAVYEMYWADLSRLGTGGLRALTSLYQLFFHLNTLAADVVDQVSLSTRGGTAWRLLQRLHAWMAWLMKAPSALLQLAMLLMVLFGAAALVSPELQPQLIAAAFGLGAIVMAALAVLTWLRAAPGPARWLQLAFLVVAAPVSLATALFALRAEHWVPMIYFAASALAVTLLGAYLVERYSGVAHGVRLPGHVLVLGTLVLLAFYANALLPRVSTQVEWMITASLNAGEWLLAALLLVWAVFVALQIAALLLGWWLGRGCDKAARASLHTSRLLLVGSTGLFAVLSLVLWSVISFVAGRTVPPELRYEPIVFGTGYRSVELFLQDRVQTLGGFFTPLVLAFTLLGAAVLLVLLPSLVEEISPSKSTHAWADRLGRWLGAGIRWLGTAFKLLVPLGAIAGSALYLAFVLQQFALADWLDLLQGETLVAAGKWLAGGALTIAALGSRFTHTFGRLRVAIDAVLDIDNYFGDPPNRLPPRARIYSRYASLLAYLRDAGYARIVIVAHSQGTVISAELLRYLHVQGRLPELVGAAQLALVTVGSPLRDLYAERFPLLYRWMGSREAGFATAAPAAADLGVTEWVNACRSGDYVGRFLWTPETEAARFGPQPRRAGDRTELCLGAGAHTHYFDRDAAALAVEIERIRGRSPN